MTDYSERRILMRKQARARVRRDRWDNILVGLVVALGGLGVMLGVMVLFGLLGAIGIYIGWNLGVYGLAHAVHTEVGHIGWWTAFGASFAIGVIRRLFSNEGVKLDYKKK